MDVERLVTVKKVTPDFYKDGVEFLKMLREEKKCPVCQTETIVSMPEFSSEGDNKCDNQGCGERYYYPEYPARPDIPDFPEDVYGFGWRISRARARWVKKQAGL